MHTSMLIFLKTIKFCHQDFAPKILMHFFGGGGAPKYFTAVFRKQLGPRSRMDSQGPQSISLVDFELLVWTKIVILWTSQH